MLRQKKFYLPVFLGISFLFCNLAKADWQSTLESTFPSAKVVETFDELQDWTPGGQYYSMAGCDTCASNRNLPQKTGGGSSIWSLWNNKGISFEYTPGNGTFAIGDVITGSTSGATATVRQIWNVDNKNYIQITSNPGVQGSTNLVAGENISSGTKTGTNIQWPLFIANHGVNHTWQQTGKSLMMDLGDNSTSASSTNPSMEGIGAQRMATYFGDGASGKSGYKKPYVFFMMKVTPTFFQQCLSPYVGCQQGGLDTLSVIKVFDLDSGFTSISKWGTDQDRAQVDPNNQNYYRLDEYGLNFSVFNFYGGGSTFFNTIYFNENPAKAAISTGSLYTYQLLDTRNLRNGTTTDINPYIMANQWFGVEVAYDIGTPDQSDATLDFWIYNQDGTEMGHFTAPNDNHLVYFDHYYNKFVLGGNRLSANYGSEGLDARWWIDDLIINDSRIGPTYFSALHRFQSTYSNLNFVSLVSDWFKKETGNVNDLNSDTLVNTKDLGIMMNKWN